MESTAQSVANLFNDAQALEKVLKLFQAVTQIVAGMQASRSRGEVVRWSKVGREVGICKYLVCRWISLDVG